MKNIEEVFMKADQSIRDMLEAVSDAEQAKLIAQLLSIGVLLESDSGIEGEYVGYVCTNWDKRNDEDFVAEIEIGTINTKAAPGPAPDHLGEQPNLSVVEDLVEDKEVEPEESN